MEVSHNAELSQVVLVRAVKAPMAASRAGRSWRLSCCRLEVLLFFLLLCAEEEISPLSILVQQMGKSPSRGGERRGSRDPQLPGAVRWAVLGCAGPGGAEGGGADPGLGAGCAPRRLRTAWGGGGSRASRAEQHGPAALPLRAHHRLQPRHRAGLGEGSRCLRSPPGGRLRHVPLPR